MKQRRLSGLILTFLIILLSIVLLSGCSKILPLFEDKKPDTIADLSGSSILIDQNEIRSETIKMINNAKKAIFIQLSTLDDKEIIQLLAQKSRSGIEVRILLDQWQRENSDTVKNLKNQNVSVQYYPAQKGQYQRIRYIVVDYVSGVFYGQDWSAKGFATHSLAIKLTDDTAWSMAKSFNKDWSYTTTLSLDLPENVDFPEDNMLFTVNAGVKQQILKYIGSATTEIYAQVEQLSDSETVQALLEAKERGCAIRLIVSPSCAVATPNTIQKFKEAGIEIRYYNHPQKLPMGFNLGVFDQKTLVVTSSSWTYYSFIINHESALIIPSPSAIDKINLLFEQEWETGILP